jgi:hypothetical protein
MSAFSVRDPRGIAFQTIPSAGMPMLPGAKLLCLKIEQKCRSAVSFKLNKV